MALAVKMKSASNLIRIFEDDSILICNTRLSYPHLFKAYGGTNDNGEEAQKKFSAKFLLELAKRKDDIIFLRKHILAFAQTEFKLKTPEFDAGRLCLKNGSGSGKPEQEGHWILSASELTKPQVVDRSRQDVTEEDDVVYAGCYVNALIRLWAQNNKFGKRVNANLLSVQFFAPGDRFSESGPRPAATDVFEEFEGGEMEGDGLGNDGLDDGLGDEL